MYSHELEAVVQSCPVKKGVLRNFEHRFLKNELIQQILYATHYSIQSYKMLLEDFPLPSLSELVMEKSTLLYMHKL